MPAIRQGQPSRGAAPVFASGAKQSSSTTLAEVALPWVASLRSR